VCHEALLMQGGAQWLLYSYIGWWQRRWWRGTSTTHCHWQRLRGVTGDAGGRR